MNSQYQVKAMLKEIAAFLHKHDGQLFGKTFRNDIANTIKSNRKIRKIFTDSKNTFYGAPNIHRNGVRGKSFFSSRREDQITKNSIMIVASFVNRHRKSTKIW